MATDQNPVTPLTDAVEQFREADQLLRSALADQVASSRACDAAAEAVRDARQRYDAAAVRLQAAALADQ